ncbi:cytochrome P450 [Amycolatopsis anabasis]|uniref:cytochrome P450 n=1 Tax=Amycolatopsis anabasis TaxID=1840409 RepID=UPI00131AC547|nr:cytochrome P450 [Amycolatopsis anabasis]
MTSIAGATGDVYSVPRSRDHTVRYRPAEFLLALYRMFGPVVPVGRGRRGYTYLLGPDANQFVLANSDLFRWRDAFDWLIPVDGATSMLLSDGAEHRQRRRLAQPAMHHRQIAAYLDTMADNADAMIESWRPGQVVDVYQDMRTAIRRTTLHTLFGPRLAADAEFFGTQLQRLLDLCDGLPQTVAGKQRLRTPQWRRAMAARSRVDERIYTEIRRVRQESDTTAANALTALVHGRDEDGERLSDQEVRDQVVTLIVAGYETTSATLGWAVYAMLSTPGVWDTARREVREVLGGRRPAPEDLKRLTYLGSVVQETLRLYPAVTVVGRKVDQDFEYRGRRIRAGASVVISPYVTHRLPELWPDPLRFQPERWQPGNPDYRKPAPHHFLPFGGGPHRCIGATMATTELTVMLARLLARTSLTLPAQRLRAASMISMRPRRGLRAEVSAPSQM